MLDSSDEKKLQLNFNVTLHHLPCRFASLDIVDVMGTHLQNVSANILKTRLDASGTAVIAAALSANATGLTELWIGSNKLGAAGAAAVAAGVAASTTLERAWLDAVGMAPDAAPALASALSAKGGALHQLWLGSNALDDGAAAELADAIAAADGASSVRRLWLEGNPIGKEGAHSLFAAAGSLGCTLRELRLSTEQIGGDAQEAIAALIADAAPDAVEAGRAPTLEAGEGVVTVCFG